ncbi:hypothetical protein G9F31_13810 [Acinetobacter sp. 187]|uniref:Uncharacterized protein n=1 Tax=Acinetobacter lanii TaxID=2715163 RepID=A0A6G8S5T5_9GAMM|nr:hypothetical protein [Acinetobacter lanii]NHC04823.1 hypothetical protein [Acinetobacter lanii]QIO09398.1 hypothetical protein G8D99_10445 [Acinetobacter lanii]
MRKLQFTADCREHDHSQENVCHVTQGYVTELLSKKLVEHGFKMGNVQSANEQLAIQVEDNPIELGVNCSLKNKDGVLVCEISAHANEEQDWFEKIETQSVIKQLAQAVEDTLKQDAHFSEFSWKG